MAASVNSAFNKLEKQLNDLFQRVEMLSDEQQNFKPDPQSWSILQVFRHMMQSEGQIDKYLRKKILGTASTQKASFKAKFRSLLLNLAMRLPVKYKVPDAIKVDFDAHYDFNTLTSDWQSLRKEFKAFLDTIDETTAQKEIFRHPVVGRMSLLQGLSFMQEHLDRHTKQVERIMQHTDFPKQ
ncbi:MAG: DinB family protein [Saprospiraceae bacterium]|nr:DinB family protein [Saprospiraceae bacterium]